MEHGLWPLVGRLRRDVGHDPRHSDVTFQPGAIAAVLPGAALHDRARPGLPPAHLVHHPPPGCSNPSGDGPAS
jgi:hypothetical protein